MGEICVGSMFVVMGIFIFLPPISSVWGFSCYAEGSNQNTNHAGVTQAASSASNENKKDSLTAHVH